MTLKNNNFCIKLVLFINFTSGNSKISHIDLNGEYAYI